MGVIRLGDHLIDRHVNVRVTFDERLKLLNDVGERSLVAFDRLGQTLEPLVETLFACRNPSTVLELFT